MTYKPTILNVAAGLYIASCIVYTIVNYGKLSEGEGWGVVAMVGLIASGLVPLIIDLLLQLFIKNRGTVNVVGLVIVIIGVILYGTA
jgi:hypothetical protein